jgi:hypothetical protein
MCGSKPITRDWWVFDIMHVNCRYLLCKVCVAALLEDCRYLCYMLVFIPWKFLYLWLVLCADSRTASTPSAHGPRTPSSNTPPQTAAPTCSSNSWSCVCVWSRWATTAHSWPSLRDFSKDASVGSRIRRS